MFKRNAYTEIEFMLNKLSFCCKHQYSTLPFFASIEKKSFFFLYYRENDVAALVTVADIHTIHNRIYIKTNNNDKIDGTVGG